MNDSIKAVCFPPAALSACSFDRKLMEEMGKTIGKEAQANDVSIVLGPAVNINVLLSAEETSNIIPRIHILQVRSQPLLSMVYSPSM